MAKWIRFGDKKPTVPKDYLVRQNSIVKDGYFYDVYTWTNHLSYVIQWSKVEDRGAFFDLGEDDFYEIPMNDDDCWFDIDEIED